MNRVTNKHLLLGVSGGIAAYKSVELARQLVQQGYEVQVVMTPAATEFVTPLALQAVTGYAVRQDLFDASAEAGMSHIALAKWADLLLIAPTTADLMADLAHGNADKLLTTLALASTAPLLLAPAMNGNMWRHPATQANLAQLVARGVQIIPPETGYLACGDQDVGRLADLTQIVAAVVARSARAIEKPLAGKQVLMTAGPTFEDIDPVRFIGNRSSGKMGYALAEAARDLGATVTLISGPSALPDPQGITTIRVRSAQQMMTQVQTHFSGQDWFISAAAVADYRVAEVATHKLKKSTDAPLTLHLVQNPDIVAWAAQQTNRGRVIAFAAETESLIEHASLKRVKKGVDAILANWVGTHLGFEQEDNQLLLIDDQGVIDLGAASKIELSYRVWQALLAR